MNRFAQTYDWNNGIQKSKLIKVEIIVDLIIKKYNHDNHNVTAEIVTKWPTERKNEGR